MPRFQNDSISKTFSAPGLLTKYGDALYGLALKITGEQNRAEQIIRDVFSDMHNSPPAYNRYHSAFMLLLYKAREYCNKYKPELKEIPAQHAGMQETADKVFEMIVLCGKNIKYTAAFLNVDEDAVKKFYAQRFWK